MSPRFTCLRPIAEQEYSFWKYFIHSEKVMRPILVNSTKSGTMMNELVVEDFLKQEILVPPLPEQCRIGAFFDRLDSLITLHQRKYDKLCVLKNPCSTKCSPKGGSAAIRRFVSPVSLTLGNSVSWGKLLLDSSTV